ncbi:molybdenum ABC transporter ATP-binding protein [Stappia sp. F7233]|uniref:Molybdenum ABC transporter ATP-binding protein n=1 Tax=Stappia albiluteola TaxID=2758565 RepID=A0A839AFS8_9HYPH|nr:molybdenum ABC transporter ATP-binding protein [Stappia albiluteola]MBA5777409.1 molybdenum ABC transporter ATP-binding protein [Stappia albiluteola]
MIDISILGRAGDLPIAADFHSSEGVMALFGQSGAGKSTITKMIAGLIRPDAGRIAINGDTLFDSGKGIDVPVRRRRIGHVFQEARLFPHLSVRSNLTFARLAGRRIEPAAFDEVVELLGIAPLLARRPGSLSGGEKQRVAIGRALLSSPRALVMDEPLASLDPGRKAEILPFLDRLCHESRIPIIYVSHALEEVARLADTLTIVSQGRTVATGPIAEIMTRLDLGVATGRHEAGSIIEGRVVGQDADWGLTTLSVEDQLLQVPSREIAVGATVRLRIRARDVSIAIGATDGLSIRNRLSVSIEAITDESGPYAELLCRVGRQPLRARLTRASVADLDLHPGKTVTALIKTIAIDRREITGV